MWNEKEWGGILRKSMQNHTRENFPQPKAADENSIPEDLIEVYEMTKTVIDKIKNTDVPKTELGRFNNSKK